MVGWHHRLHGHEFEQAPGEPLSRVRLLRTHGLWPARFLCPWDSPGKISGVGYHFCLQGIFLTQRSNLGSPALQADSLPPEL